MPILSNPRHERGSKYEISMEFLREILDYDAVSGIFRWKCNRRRVRAGSIAGTDHNKGYIDIVINRRRYLAHRLAWFWVTGYWPDGQIDHKNGNRKDNSFCNLRLASPSENSANGKIRATNSSGFKGVSASGRKWRAYIMKGGKQYHLGKFLCPADAHQAYLRAAKGMFGEYARGS